MRVHGNRTVHDATAAQSALPRLAIHTNVPASQSVGHVMDPLRAQPALPACCPCPCSASGDHKDHGDLADFKHFEAEAAAPSAAAAGGLAAEASSASDVPAAAPAPAADPKPKPAITTMKRECCLGPIPRLRLHA